MAKKPTPAFGSDMARRIWLAGIGAYGNAFSEAQESLSKASGETARKFEELVSKGEMIEQTVEAKRQEVVKKVSAAPAAFSLDDRIKHMRERLGITPMAEDTASQAAATTALTEQLDRIEAKLDALLAQQQNGAPTAKTQRTTKRATKKTTTKSSSKKS